MITKSLHDLPFLAAMKDPLNVGLTSYWRLDEVTTGAAAVDSSIGGNNLTDTQGIIQRAACKRNNGADYYDPIWVTGGGAPPGLYDGLRIADNATLGIGAGVSFTITGWFNEIIRNGSVFFCKANDSNDTTTIDYALTSNGTEWSWNVYDTGNLSRGAVVSGGGANTWFFVAAGFDLANTVCWLQVNAGTRATGVCGSVRRTGSGFSLGNWYNARAGVGNYNPLLGYADEVGFWRRSLSTAEVTRLYNSGTPLDPHTFL